MSKNEILYVPAFLIRVFGTITERDFREKKSTAPKHIQIDSMLRSVFFFRTTRSVMVPRFGFFFKDSRIMVKTLNFELTQLIPKKHAYSWKEHLERSLSWKVFFCWRVLFNFFFIRERSLKKEISFQHKAFQLYNLSNYFF